MVYDHAAIQLRGPDALTNFSTPVVQKQEQEYNKTSSGYNSGNESNNTVKSPKSVLRSVSTTESHSQAEAESHSAISSPSPSINDAVVADESLPIFPASDDVFNLFENPVPVPDLFDQVGFSDSIFGWDDMLIGSNVDFGFGFGDGFSTWQTDDYFQQDFGDIFGSDPLAAL